MRTVNVRSDKLLYALSLAGLVIGISILTVLLELADGGKSLLGSRYWDKGMNVYEAKPEQARQAAAFEFFSSNKTQIRSEVPEIKSILPVIKESGSIKSYRGSRDIDICAIGQKYPELINLKLLSGRFITDGDLSGEKKVVVLDDITAYELFGSRNAVGRSVELGSGDEMQQFAVIGVFNNCNRSIKSLYEKKVAGVCLIPETVAREMQLSSVDTAIILFAAKEMKKDEFISRVEHYFSKYSLGIPEVRLYSQLASVADFGDKYNMILLLTAIVALLLGGILMAYAAILYVTQRSTELALTRLYGASSRDITEEILYRLVSAALAGGAAGIAAGTLCAVLIGYFMNLRVGLTLDSIAAAACVSGFIGVVSGLLSANYVKNMENNNIIW